MNQLKYNNFNQERIIGGLGGSPSYTIYLPDPPDLKDIANHKLPKEKQKFYVTPLPKDIKQWDAKSREEFERAEWKKRQAGFFWMNNGNIEYMTGTNYLYVNWWNLDIGLPSFVDADQEWYFMWDYVKKNPKARGMIFLSNRREGKTYKAICAQYDEVSKTPNAMGGIQSKNNIDASKVFNKLIQGWRKLPYFFKPVDIGDSYPKSKLDFSEPSRRNTKIQEKEYSLVLNSSIDFENAKEEAYDGVKQLVNIQDEIGKTVEIDVNARYKIVKECVMDGSRIIGKIIATSTVEEMEKKGGENCQKLWNGADPTKLLPNGQTQNGLLGLFKPAYYGFRGENEGEDFVDEYGYSNKEAAKKYIEDNRKALTDRDDVISDRRKYPFTIHDCFIKDSKKAVYDVAKIEQQIEHNRSLQENILTTGNFTWKNGVKDTIVEFHHNANGRWKVSWLPKPDDRNKIMIKCGQRSPGNTDIGCFGLDPYDNKTTVDNRKSDAAAYGFRKFDPMAPYDTGIFILEYVNRPKLPEIMWEDMIMMCVFYGWEILVESNKIGTINHFRQRGYDKYLMYRPDETQTASSMKMKEPGIPLSGDDARMALVYATETYIINKVGLIEEEGVAPYMGKCYFNKLLENWRDFDFEKKWTEFDSMVGGGLAILGSRTKVPKKVEKKTFNLFPMYKIAGKGTKPVTFKK